MRILFVQPSSPTLDRLIEYVPKLAQVTTTDTTREASVYLEMVQFNLVILGPFLSSTSGVAFCHQLRQTGFSGGILALQSELPDEQVVEYLRAGADDVAAFPSPPSVFLAKVQALERRSVTPLQESVVQVGQLKIDLMSGEVWYQNQACELRRKELLLLAFLMKHPHQIMTRERLFDHIWGVNSPSDLHTVDVHIQALRHKIDHRFGIELIKTSYGMGYKLVCPTSPKMIE